MEKYSLIVEGPYYYKLEISFQHNNKKTTKPDLLTIDTFTTQFTNKSELIEFLKDKNNIIKEVDNIYIIDSNNKVKEIAYSDCNVLNNLNLIGDKINTDTKEYKKILFNFLKQLEEQEFFEYIIKEVDLPLKINLVRRIKFGDYSNNAINEIIKNIDNYESLRNLTLLCHKYKLKKLMKNKEEIQKKYQKIIQKKTF